MAESKRIYALDVLRGLTVALMIVVNNAGGSESFAQLQHSQWHGLTLCDMVFPAFLFIVGITAYISLSKSQFEFSWPLFGKITKRAGLIILIGWCLHLLSMLLKTGTIDLGHLRLTGVLPRIGLCYFAVSIIALVCRRKAIMWIIGGLLIAYGFLLLAGNGLVNDADNILAKLDRAILGTGHLYTKQPIDPEGIASTIGSLAHTLIGFCIGSLLCEKRPLTERLLSVSVWGFILLCAGLAVSLILPVNKRIWSPSFALITCGLVALTLATISFFTDTEYKSQAFTKAVGPFDVFGVNPLLLYALSEVVAIVISACGCKPAIYGWLNSFIPSPCWASAAYSLIFVLVMWSVGYPLYRKKIYIKL